MDKEHIISAIVSNHDAFFAKLDSLSDEEFLKQPGNKWSAGQQLDHLIKSVKPVDMAFGLPMFVLKMKFGVANRPSKSYEDLVTKYLNALGKKSDFKIPSEFDPKQIPLERRKKASEKLDKLVHKLCSRLSKFSEEELDNYILPHPLMGKVTLREMLYFTAYHVQHHDKQILENLANADSNS
ncbi:DinB family protein [Croceivirga thetidis]|uniref:DinB family protein n=1 Tax=Croceivirga thetidis TaxID=2721623 RepID=A0ABX1GWL0_9FLAO|nr:DinB family protein [Croceivirga thetidis]NKI33102.1 DinB family protein [Croceivirga thetidis]